LEAEWEALGGCETIVAVFGGPLAVL
jgi:hypothetical protein